MSVIEAASSEELREGALRALGPAGDARAVFILTWARLAVRRGVSSWESSQGSVVAHRVLVGTDARSLGVLRAYPAVDDALVAALGAALSSFAGHSLEGVRYHWALHEPKPALDYRGATQPLPVVRDEVGALHDAVRAYLQGAGLTREAEQVADMQLVLRAEARTCHVRLRHARGERFDAVILRRALGDLLAGPEQREVRVMFSAV